MAAGEAENLVSVRPTRESLLIISPHWKKPKEANSNIRDRIGLRGNGAHSLPSENKGHASEAQSQKFLSSASLGLSHYQVVLFTFRQSSQSPGHMPSGQPDT